MRRWTLIRFLVLVFLTAGLAVPPGALEALAQQQGPITPPPAQGPQQQGPQKPPPPKPPQQKPPQYAISVESQLVRVDTVVTDQDGNIITGLKKNNFRIFDNGEPQNVSFFAPTAAPITIVMLVEFSQLGGYLFAYNAVNWSGEFLSHLGPKDWVALMTYDLKPHIVVDFTRNKADVRDAISSLYFPGFKEANEFDAVLDTLGRLKDVHGKKAILLITSGRDTFSRHTLGQTYDALKQTDVTIFGVNVSEYWLERFGIDSITYLQGENELRTFARLTGGYAWFPRFDGEIPDIFNSVVAFLRNQYSLGFTPTNAAHDGKYHKLKVEVVDDQGNPLFVTNRKGKKRKIEVYAREGYVAQKGAIGD